jgi:CheY-like chemotaxis protein
MAGLIEGRADRARWGLQGFLRGVTVLVVEDDADVRDAVGLLMESFGARLLLAVDGADALAQLDASSPDLILSDLAMPNLNGSMLIQHVRRDAIQAHLPAMAMRAHDPRGLRCPRGEAIRRSGLVERSGATHEPPARALQTSARAPSAGRGSGTYEGSLLPGAGGMGAPKVE